jgi:glycosyltransferase involved in cell wall biosynthesis
MPTPFLSIVISTFNDAENLNVTLQSLAYLKSKEENFEVIIVDGASKDYTCDVVKQFSEIIDSFISEPDHGIYDAWNKALKKCQGQYISFLGAGDIYVEEGLKSLVASALLNPEDEFIHSKALVHSGNSAKVIGRKWKWSEFRHFMKVVHCGAFHKSTLFDNRSGFDSSYKIAGDYEFLLRKGDALKTRYIDEVAVEMAPFGVSQSHVRVFVESARAKIANRAVPWWSAFFDMLYALLVYTTMKISLC